MLRVPYQSDDCGARARVRLVVPAADKVGKARPGAEAALVHALDVEGMGGVAHRRGMTEAIGV